jgi:hypothetical protein
MLASEILISGVMGYEIFPNIENPLRNGSFAFNNSGLTWLCKRFIVLLVFEL